MVVNHTKQEAMLGVTNQRKKCFQTTAIPSNNKKTLLHMRETLVRLRGKRVFVQSPNLHKLIGEKDLFTFFYSLDPMRETAGENLWRQFSQRNLSLPLSANQISLLAIAAAKKKEQERSTTTLAVLGPSSLRRGENKQIFHFVCGKTRRNRKSSFSPTIAANVNFSPLSDRDLCCKRKKKKKRSLYRSSFFVKTRQIALIAVMACNDSRTKIPPSFQLLPKAKNPLLLCQIDCIFISSILFFFLFFHHRRQQKMRREGEEEEKKKNARPSISV